jgi:hypothetical protein
LHATCEPIIVTHKPVSSSGAFNPSIPKITSKEDDGDYSYVMIWSFIALLIVILAEHVMSYRTVPVMERIQAAKERRDYATVKVLITQITDGIVLQELEGWLKEFMVYDTKNEPEIAKRIGYLGDTEVWSQKGIDKIKELCEVPMVLRITGPHTEQQDEIRYDNNTYGCVTVEDQPSDVLVSSMNGIQNELENMNKINLLSLRQQSLQHSYALEQRNRELQVMRELTQFSSIEKTRRKIERELSHKNYRKWLGLVMVVCTIQFFIPLLIKIVNRPSPEEMCLIPSINLGVFTLVEKKSLCFSLPDRLGVGMLMWSAFVFCRFFGIVALQPILFLIAMWCTDLHLVVSCITLQVSWIVILYVVKENCRGLYNHFVKISLCVVTISCLTAYFLHPYVYSLINQS